MGVTYEQFSIFAARVSVLENIVEMLLAREIGQRSDIGRFWTDRVQTARADLEDATKWKDITPDPMRSFLRELVAIVDRAAELAPSGPKGEGSQDD